MDFYKPEYNICPTAGNSLGRKHSEETKQKLREANLGKKYSKEYREKITLSKIGTKLSEETKKKISNSHKIKVLQFDADDNFIREWDSVSECNNNIGGGLISLYRALKDFSILHKNYKFKYKKYETI